MTSRYLCLLIPYLSLLIGLLFNSIFPPRPSVLDRYNVKSEQARYVLQVSQCSAHVVGHLIVSVQCFVCCRIFITFMVHSSPFRDSHIVLYIFQFYLCTFRNILLVHTHLVLPVSCYACTLLLFHLVHHILRIFLLCNTLRLSASRIHHIYVVSFHSPTTMLSFFCVLLRILCNFLLCILCYVPLPQYSYSLPSRFCVLCRCTSCIWFRFLIPNFFLTVFSFPLRPVPEEIYVDWLFVIQCQLVLFFIFFFYLPELLYVPQYSLLIPPFFYLFCHMHNARKDHRMQECC